MLTPHEMIVGMALVDRHNRANEAYLNGWSGILAATRQHQVLIKKNAMLEIQTVHDMAKAIDERAWLTGLIQYNGQVIPLIDIGRLSHIANQGVAAREPQVVIVETSIGVVGLVVDKILGYRDYWSDDSALNQIKTHSSGVFSHTLVYAQSEVLIMDIEKFVREIMRTG